MNDAGALARPSANPASVTILVVQKDVLIRVLITEQLRAQGYTCIEVGKADEALDVLHGHARVDLVLTGLRLSGTLDGGAFARVVRTEFPFIKVLMVSGELPDSSVSEMLDAHVRKPFLTEQLVREVQALVPTQTSPVLP